MINYQFYLFIILFFICHMELPIIIRLCVKNFLMVVSAGKIHQHSKQKGITVSNLCMVNKHRTWKPGSSPCPWQICLIIYPLFASRPKKSYQYPGLWY